MNNTPKNPKCKDKESTCWNLNFSDIGNQCKGECILNFKPSPVNINPIDLLNWLIENGWSTSDPMWVNGEEDNYVELTSQQIIDLYISQNNIR